MNFSVETLQFNKLHKANDLNTKKAAAPYNDKSAADLFDKKDNNKKTKTGFGKSRVKLLLC